MRREFLLLSIAISAILLLVLIVQATNHAGERATMYDNCHLVNGVIECKTPKE